MSVDTRWFLMTVLILSGLLSNACGKENGSGEVKHPSNEEELSQSSDGKMTPKDRAEYLKRIEQMKEDLQGDDANIAFYGIVRDQDRVLLEGVTVYVSYWHYDKKAVNGVSGFNVNTDKDGRFSITGIRGSKLFIGPLEKQGYMYDTKKKVVFDYRPYISSRFVPDETKPVDFFIRKKNPPTLVIPTGLYANEPFLRIQYQKNYLYNISSVKYWEEGHKPDKFKDIVPDLKIVADRMGDAHGRYRVKLIISSETEGGGLQIGEKGFTAPAEGYKEEVDTGGVEPDQMLYVFIRQKGPIYRRLNVDLTPHSDTVTLDIKSWTNPTGDRNLEYDEAIYKEYLKKQEEERKKRRTLVIPMKSRMELRYGTIYYYNVLAAKYWDEGHRPDNMTPDIKIVTTLSEENGRDKAKFIITAVAKGDQALVGEKMDVVPADDYKDIVEFEYINTPIDAGDMGYVYLKQKGPVYSRLDFYGSADVDMARFTISSWTNPTGDRNLEYDKKIYEEYLKKNSLEHPTRWIPDHN